MQCFRNSGTSANRKLVSTFTSGRTRVSKHRENRAIQHTVGMIGHHHHRTASGNPRLIRRTDAQSDPHLSEQILQAKSVRRLLHPPVQVPDFVDRS